MGWDRAKESLDEASGSRPVMGSLNDFEAEAVKEAQQLTSKCERALQKRICMW